MLVEVEVAIKPKKVVSKMINIKRKIEWIRMKKFVIELWFNQY